MARSNNNLNAVLKDTADAIRVKKGTSEPIIPRDFADEIESIQAGGGDEDFKNLLTGNTPAITLPSEIGVTDELQNRALFGTNIAEINLNHARVIPSGCFFNANVETINGADVEIVKMSACSSCFNLKTANISPFWIDADAFNMCYKLESFNFNNVYNIGASAFAYCSKLNSVEIGYRLYSMSDSAFAYCSSLSQVRISAFISPAGLFNSCSNLVSADLFQIGGRSTFSGCTNLVEVKALSVQGGGSYIFNNCINLERISAFTANTLEACCFQSCYKLKEISLICSVIASSTFKNCSSLESLYFLTCSNSTNLQFSNAFDGTPMVNETLLGHYGSIFVPSSLVAMYRSANNWSLISDRITSLPSDLSSKYAYAYEFYNQSSLSQIPSEKLGVERVLSYAFYNCNKLEEINLPDCKMIDVYAFNSAGTFYSHGMSVSFPACEVILDNAFYMGFRVGALDLPNVKILGRTWAAPLSQLSIPNCEVFRGVFSTSLVSLYAPKCLTAEVGQNNYSLTSIDLPLVEFLSLGMNNPNISYINAPKAEFLLVGINVLNNSYWRLFSFSTVKVFQGLMSNSYVEEVNLPNCLMLNGNCFARMSKLSKINLPQCRLIDGGADTFRNLPSLTKISMPMLVGFTRINYSIFYGNANLSKALFPKLKEIGWSWFGDCPKMESLYLFNGGLVVPAFGLGTQLFSQSTTFANSAYLGHYGSIYVPLSLISYYQNASVWSQYSDRFVGMTDEEMQYVIDHWDD